VAALPDILRYVLRRTLLLFFGVGSAALNVHRAFLITSDDSAQVAARFAVLVQETPQKATVCYTPEPKTEQDIRYFNLARYALIPRKVVTASDACDWWIGPDFELKKESR
jgi:hypothetical protein